MKTLIIIILLFVGAGKASTQSYMQLQTYQDTANYLIHEIEMKKNLFEDKPFSVLLDSLKVSPKFIYKQYTPTGHPDEGKGLNIDFNFEDEFNKQHFMTVDFQSAPNLDTLRYIYNQRHTVVGQQQVIELYKTLIIKDVGIKIYSDDEPPKPGITDNSNL